MSRVETASCQTGAKRLRPRRTLRQKDGAKKDGARRTAAQGYAVSEPL